MTDFYVPPEGDMNEPKKVIVEERFKLRSPPKFTSIISSIFWIINGFKLLFSSVHAFWMMVAMLLVSVMVYGCVTILSASIPVVGGILSNAVFLMLLAGGYLLIDQLIKTNEVKIELLFAVLTQKRYMEFLHLALLQFVIGMGLLVLFIPLMAMILEVGVGQLISGYFDIITQKMSDEEMQVLMQELLDSGKYRFIVALSIILFLPISGIMFFSPALLILNKNVTVMDSVKYGIIGFVKNTHAFIIYWIIATIMILIGVIPVFAGLIIVFPALFISAYYCYQEIYLEKITD